MGNESRDAYWLRPWLTMIIVAIYLFPSIRTPGGLPSIRVEEVLLFPFVIYCMLRVIWRRDVTLAWGTRQSTLLVFFVFLLVSMLTGLIFGLDASFGDYNQIIRYSKYIFIYTVSVSFINLSSKKSRRADIVLNTVILCSALASLIVVQQFFDLFGLNSTYVTYVAPTQHETLLGDYPFPRPVGMIGNPNEVGFAFVLGALASSYRLIKGGGWMYLVATLCNLVALGLTLSRTSLVALVAGVGYLYAIQVFLRDQRGLGERLKYFAFPTSVLVAVIGYVLANPILYDVIGWRFYTLLEFQSTSSWQVRLQSWQKNIRLFMDSPIFGVGPLRRAEVTAGAADNEWLLLLRTYGIVGTIALIGGVVWPNMRAKPGLRRVFVSSLLLGTAVYMIPAAVFHSLSLMPLLLILIAVEDPTTCRLTIP